MDGTHIALEVVTHTKKGAQHVGAYETSVGTPAHAGLATRYSCIQPDMVAADALSGA